MDEREKEILEVLSRRKEMFIQFSLVVLVFGLFLFSSLQLEINYSRMVRGLENLRGFMVGMFPPNLSIIPDVWPQAIESIQIAIMGTVLGIFLSIFLSIFAAKNLTPFPLLGILLKGFFALTRAIPALIWAILFIIAVGLGSLPGILALGVNSIGMLGKVFSELFEDVQPGITEAILSTGASRIQVFSQGIVPEVLPAIISWSLFRLDINIRYSSILGVVGAGGIGWELVRASRMLDYQATLTVTLFIFVMVLLVEQLTAVMRRAIR